MNNENPYHPPSGELLLPESPVRGGKRPKSQKWLLFFFGAIVAARVYWIFRIPPLGVVEAATFFYMIVPLVALVFFRRATATYYISSVSLLWFCIAGSWDWLMILLREFDLGSGKFLPHLFGAVFDTWLLYLLTRHYVFGAASRAYYGLGPIRAAN